MLIHVQDVTYHALYQVEYHLYHVIYHIKLHIYIHKYMHAYTYIHIIYIMLYTMYTMLYTFFSFDHVSIIFSSPFSALPRAPSAASAWPCGRRPPAQWLFHPAPEGAPAVPRPGEAAGTATPWLLSPHGDMLNGKWKQMETTKTN